MSDMRDIGDARDARDAGGQSRTGAGRTTDAAQRIARFLDAATARLRRVWMVRAAALGLALASLCVGAGMIVAWSMSRDLTRSPAILATSLVAFVALVTPLVGARARARSLRAHIASIIESRVSAFRNRLLTADEAMRTAAGRPGVVAAPPVASASSASRNATDPAIVALVQRQAATVIPSVDLASLFPYTRALRELGGAAALVVVALLLPVMRSALQRGGEEQGIRGMLGASGEANSAGIDLVRVTVVSPAYSGGATRTLDDPTRVEALEDSRLRISVRSRAREIRLTAGDDRIPTSHDGDTFTAVIPIVADGFVSIDALDETGKTAGRRLVGISALADGAPRVRIVTPRSDLVLKSASQTLPIAIEADDDLALSSLSLRYTKVSGSGERYTFADGEVPLRITRDGAKRWSAHADWNLSPIALAAGDMVVYRAVTRDRRPGREAVESDALIAQLLSGDGDAALGFAVDPEEDRQAVSQQMVVLKTERLLARKASMTDSAFATAARDLALEQRRVRAEFVFMMGGEMAESVDAETGMGDLDEHAEAEAEADLSAGRMVNRGRVSLLAAIRSMSRATQAFEATSVPPALGYAKRAVDEIQEAFARSRFLMRALSQREQLDMTRRGSGDLKDASRLVFPLAIADRDERVVALRTALRDLGDLRTTLSARSASPAASRSDQRGALVARVSGVAERVLRIDASSPAVKRAADDLIAVARAIDDGKLTTVTAPLDRASSALASLLQSTADAEAAVPSSARARRLSTLTNDVVPP